LLYEFFCIFEISDFYCNQFWKQGPRINDEITFFCEMKNKTIFSTLGKIDINGDNADPLYKYLKENSNGFLGDSIKWNFTKFLIDREGNIINRYAPITNPSKISGAIEKLLAK